VIADADHDEAIKRENTLFMADHIPNAELLIVPGVSHFAFIQDPDAFTFAIEHFLDRVTHKAK
jgi:pimeloyl-ACP methyl ester carboxylesterase